jgi:hypothetical protein
MSGANIGSGTIPYASLASDYRIIRASGTYNFFAGAATVAATLTGDLNTLYGTATGYNLTTGNANSFYGSSAGNNCTTNSSANTVIGANAMSGYSSGSCSNNSVVGFAGLSSISSGLDNCGLGYSVLSVLTTGSSNCFLGRYGGSAIVSGSFNCGIGDQVDYNSSNDSNYCSFLGASSRVTASGLSFVTCIGANTSCGTSNTIQLGSNLETVAISGNLLSGSNTITATQLGYLSAVSTGIVDTSTSQTIGGAKTFSTAPVMSGASISSGTIGQTQVSNGYIDLSSAQSSIGGNKTFTGLIQINNQYVHSSFTLTTGTTLSISSPFYEIYPLAPTANLTITLPAASATYIGVRIQFRRTGGTTTTTITSATSNIYPNNSLTLTNSIMASGVYTAIIYCTYVTATTYAWYFA